MKSAFDLKLGMSGDELAQLVKSKGLNRTKATGEIFTPREIVRFMLKESAQRLKDNDSGLGGIKAKILEPSCGNGQLLTHILAYKWDCAYKYILSDRLLCQNICNSNTMFSNFGFEVRAFSIGLCYAIGRMFAIDLMQDNVRESQNNCIDTLCKIWEYFMSCELFPPLENELKNIFETNIVCANSLLDCVIFYMPYLATEGVFIKETIQVRDNQFTTIPSEIIQKHKDSDNVGWVTIKKPYKIESWSEIKDLPKIYKGEELPSEWISEIAANKEQSQFKQAWSEGRLF